MIGDLEDLERDIACGLEKVAKGLQERYVEFQPLLKVAEEDIVLKLEDLSNSVNEKLQLADSFLRENSMDASSRDQVFDEFVSYPSTDVKGTVHMHIRNSDSKDISEMLAALSLLGELDKRMKKWATYVVKNFVQPIIDSQNGVDPYERFTISNDTAEFTASSKVRPTVNGISIEGVVSSLKRFFSHLASATNEIVLNNRPLSLCLGGFFQEELMTVFLKQCVAASIPVPDSDGSKLKHAMEIAEQFRKDMIELGFFNDATPTFQAFSEQHFTVFIDRRCLEVIKRAKELICMPYLELAEVGNGEEVSEETILQYKEAFGKMMPKSITACDSLYPLLLQLPRCKVSQSTVDLMELLFTTLNDAVTTDNEKLSARLALTARNVVQLFELTAPRHHGTAISSMPQMAAIFYNDCKYICHRLMLMPFSVLKGVDKQSQKYANFRPILTDSLWKLREIAADMLEQAELQLQQIAEQERTQSMTANKLKEMWKEASQALRKKLLKDFPAFKLLDKTARKRKQK
ncbi:Centromere/kinetochore Zw10 [Cooperia oncophora]